ncbi:sugar phosphate isomerase/epimerase [Desulfitobacterium dichloroeliminans LMG P-21439]|uniref:Sugar phosphate isomerase/epimerase n=1 Tax=Desulfitobacterium dichloroeliminans (strain LMG P-21439 / DCA1) TaxID=871963 RepID=L0F548_DESDL|nr:sugar phosphate isomerase/epimerase [Desulfitobacterium dichloroeliminans]AGA68317.1 sugar phosphate isomerase/epimerase [Desulfitobacterium dichloroeliminans LMG P-21439]
MKLAYTISGPDTQAKYLAYRGELEDMLASLHEIGYQGVELFVRDPREIDLRKLGQLLELNHLELAALGTGPMVSEDQLRFTSLDGTIRNEAMTRAKAAIDLAARFGSQVNVGKLRGDIVQGDEAHTGRLRDRAIKELCDYAATKNVLITIEPQCRFAINNLKSTQEALAWLQEQQLPNLYLMLDVFHMNIEDKSIAASLIEAKNQTIHVHLADNHRGVPGTGALNFPEIIRVLKALGYDRYLSMEIEQTPSCYEAAAKAYTYIQKLIDDDGVIIEKVK